MNKEYVTTQLHALIQQEVGNNGYCIIDEGIQYDSILDYIPYTADLDGSSLGLALCGVKNTPTPPSPRVIIDGQVYYHDYRKDFPSHPTSGYDGHRWEWKAIINLITNS